MAEIEKLNNNALADLDEVKRYMDITGSTDDVDDELTALINRISKSMETYCDRQFYVEEHTEYHIGDGKDSLVTDEYPITSVSGIWISTARTWDDDTLVASSEYYINQAARKVVRYNSSFDNATYENIRTIYTAGEFSTIATVPVDLKLACIKEIARNYRLRKDKGFKSRSTDGGTEGGIDTFQVLTGEFLPETLSVLQRYMKRHII